MKRYIRYLGCAILFFFSMELHADYACWYNSTPPQSIILDLSKSTAGGLLEAKSSLINNARYPTSGLTTGCGHNGWNVWHSFSMTNEEIILKDDQVGNYGTMKIKVHSNTDVGDLYLTQANMSGANSIYTGSFYSRRPNCTFYGTDTLQITVELYINRIPINPIQLPVGNIYAVGVNAQSDAEARSAGLSCDAYKNTYQLIGTGQPLWACKPDVSEILVDFGEISLGKPVRSVNRTVNIECSGVAYNMVSLEMKPSGVSQASDKGLSSNINGVYVLIGGDMNYDTITKTWKASLPYRGVSTASATLSFTPNIISANETGSMNASSVLTISVN
ncbi:TPA: hypothetical protein L7272_004905 [Escherichia coli]|nr:hypothetical protein [Escherichia coli]